MKINASMIKAGTLAVDRLVLNGTNESLIFALNNVGNLTSTHTDTIDGGLITERTITADHIVAGTITSNEIAAGTITSGKLNTAEIFSNSAILNQIFAQDITATGSITSPILKSADYAYSSGYFNSEGMIVDLKNKIIRTPNLNINGGIASKLDSILKTFGDDCSISIRPNGIDIEKDDGLGCNIAPATMSWWNADNSYQAQVGVKQWSLSRPSYSNTEIKAGNIIVTGSSINPSIYVGNNVREGGLIAGSTGNVGLWDVTNQTWILYSSTSQNVTIPHALSVTGTISATGTLSATSLTATSGSIVSAANIYAGAASDTVTRSVYARNSLRTIRMLSNASGVIGLYDETNAIFILQSSTAKSIQIGEAAQTTSIVLRHTNGYASFAGNGMELYGSTPYIDFHFNNSTADYTSRLIESESGVLTSMGTFRSNKNLGLGFGDATVTYALTSKWKDGNQHNIVERNEDGLSAYFGWAGSSTYNTRTVLRGMRIEVANGVYPTSDGKYYLGDGVHRFAQLFATIGAISTSDRNQKRNIVYDLNKTDAIFDAFRPCCYYRVDGDRMHFGLVAQEVEQAFADSGISINDVSLVCRDHLYKDGEGGIKIYLYNTDGTPQYRYGLRYEELHGLEIWQIQQLKKRVTELERKLAAMTA